MTAYGALVSLKNTIEFLHSSHFTLIEPSLPIIKLAYNELQPLQDILARVDQTSKSRSRKKVNALDERIKDTIWGFEDLLESLFTDQILSQLGSSRDERGLSLFSIDLQSLQDDVCSFIHTLKNMEEEYIYELDNMAEDDEASPAIICLSGTNSKMIGLSDQFQQVKSKLIATDRGRRVYALVGMAGIGKTTLARQIFEDPEIRRRFGCRAWATVGRKPQFKQLLPGIAAQLCGTTQGGGEITVDYLKEGTMGKKCLVVLDDVWETQVVKSLVNSIPKIKHGLLQVLLTARDETVTHINSLCSIVNRDGIVVRFLSEEESKELLCDKVFGEESFPPQLDKAATKIAKKCEGLPLTIVTVADILSKSEQKRDPEYWNDLAEERNSVFMDAYNEISKVLFPNYDYLPQHLKMLFLYMGVFPQDYDFPPSKLINMLTAEGWFHDTNKEQSLSVSIWPCLVNLCTENNLVLFQMKSNIQYLNKHIMKTCRLHSSWRHVCRGEARKNKFYHVLYRLVDGEEEGVTGQRFLCLQNNILFGIKEFYDSITCYCASTTRSVLFFGPYHQYPVPIDVGFKLLRELDALKLRFYTFPTEILTLVQLKYLALTCNGELPTTISKLFNLRVLIVHPHTNIKRYGDPSYVPSEIWDMQELEHIEILGKSLRVPNHVTTLKRLSTLVGVNASIGTILDLFKRIPNIRKLGIQIELTPYDDHTNLLSCFGCISMIGGLNTLKCIIINPVVKFGYVVPVTPSSLKFPIILKKLHLSGIGLPWVYMDAIGSLPFLEVLKFRSYAFLGSMWEAEEGSFPSLEFLLIEDSDLVQWKPTPRSFRNLNYLRMKHCYKLKQINWLSYDLKHRQVKLELVDCNPSALTWLKQLQPSPFTRLDVTVSSSFDKKPMTIKFQRLGKYIDNSKK